ncbi:ATP-binding cassette domain-containing protein [Thiolinea disciformis]|uniref:ATP-binding cassette domain-containing protein n=1 Tax=Thiolinea disciformis TaxID=125614 RepID=UPI00039FB685|nr:ATP-binding cassette domain-containing protein [Thiolinea disciformis]
MWQALKTLNDISSTREKKQAIFIFIVILLIVTAFLEMVGIAGILPILSLLGEPSIVEKKPILSQLYIFFDFERPESFLLLIGGGISSILLCSAAIRSLTTYIVNNCTQLSGHLSQRLLESYLSRPYEFFINYSTSEMAKTILSETDQVFSNVIKPILDPIAYSFVVLFLLVLLLMQDFWIAITIGRGILMLYRLVKITTQNPIIKLGIKRAIANKERFEATHDVLAGIKEVKVIGCEATYLQHFEYLSKINSQCQANSSTLATIPKYLIEATGFISIIGLALFLIQQNNSLGDSLALLGLYAISGYKLLPVAQNIYANLSRITYASHILGTFKQDLEKKETSSAKKTCTTLINLHQYICLQEIIFSYSNNTKKILNNISLTIQKESIIGIVGKTGSGKATLMDIVLGLLTPSSGRILVDDIEITKNNLHQWQKIFGYVPQQIFLTDSSIYKNIALGIPEENIEQSHVHKCAQLAQVHDFICHDLVEGYNTLVGDRGVKLSGGQRQRIGIARALYRNPEVLVMDEATSALDDVTENSMVEALQSLKGEKLLLSLHIA